MNRPADSLTRLLPASRASTRHNPLPGVPMKSYFRSTALIMAAAMLSACSQPIGLTKVKPHEAYQLATKSPLMNEGLSNDATTVLHRYNLLEVYESNPQAALFQLHRIALEDERRDILFALAELSYDWANTLPATSLTKGTPAASDAFLQSAVYAYLYLLDPGKEPLPSPYDNRFREACEIYNRALGLGFTNVSGDNLRLASGSRQLPLGKLPLTLSADSLGWRTQDFSSFYPADAYEVFGFTTHNRTPGLGLPIIAVTRKTNEAPNGGAMPVTAFLRVKGGLREIQAGQGAADIELYSSYDDHSVDVNGTSIPLQSDTTAPLAYRLNDPALWNVGLKRFFSGETVQKHMLFIQPYQPGRIPVVLVHGTGSSPVWWAEMVNTLKNDPVIRNRYQFWFYEYTSNLPVPASAADLRETLTAMVNQLDPQHKDAAMDQMVVIGHSQGGLLTHFMAVNPGNALWESISDQPFERLEADPLIKTGLQRAMFFKPLPFVKRVVFISTPHRGSFLTKDWVRELARSTLTLPVTLIQGGAEKFKQVSAQLKLPESLRDKMPTSVDGMSADSPVMKALVKLPLATGVKGHSIIAVLPGTDVKTGNDGVVEYSSAHLDGVESEFVVRSGHSAQGHPLAIEEVRRILLQHDAENGH